MLGLAAYESSSEDDAGSNPISTVSQRERKEHLFPQASQANAHSELERETTSDHGSTPVSCRPIFGPPHVNLHDAQRAPSNHYMTLSASRTIIHDLTLPPVPNLDIPPSPPGSPDPSTDAKFTHFLSLKKQGVHFNEKLSSSASLRNPSLLKAMMNHAGIDDGAQYHTSLSPALWNASDLPSWGFKEEIFKAQRELQKAVDEGKPVRPRGSVSFVAATSSIS
ncbi:HCNGP domain-containing protein [Aspergillus homomorphus CBS 101889]|uniref:HCNGP-domain-containing protein n=1 Tax=Aspergillus homomorphus (strain CBS 101889) TaxID=1450537 RepID=A0A395HLP8_ASPHC|nr:hypothetical protein BO97DRAFT_408218 [Aspergillus homomorphus CBS 101889]RAL08690.1 hypothetical protein BO97DRAFT_408218 [Aspergillus homomorphus CBS 101889]